MFCQIRPGATGCPLLLLWISREPAPTQAGGRSLWLDEDGGRPAQDPVQGTRSGGCPGGVRGGGVQLDADDDAAGMARAGTDYRMSGKRHTEWPKGPSGGDKEPIATDNGTGHFQWRRPR